MGLLRPFSATSFVYYQALQTKVADGQENPLRLSKAPSSTRCRSTARSPTTRGTGSNKVEPAPFQAALKLSGFYKQAQDQFGPEAWGLLTKYTGPIG